MPYVHVINYDDHEAATCIETALLLRSDKLKRWLLVPLLSILTIFVLPLVLYWRAGLRKKWLYSRAMAIEQATHVYIRGQGKKL